jgi:hypothetical protein
LEFRQLYQQLIQLCLGWLVKFPESLSRNLLLQIQLVCSVHILPNLLNALLVACNQSHFVFQGLFGLFQAGSESLRVREEAFQLFMKDAFEIGYWNLVVALPAEIFGRIMPGIHFASAMTPR